MKERLVIRFDGPPGPVAGRFVEVELGGSSIKIGEWEQDGNDWLLVLPEEMAELAKIMVSAEFVKGMMSLEEVTNGQLEDQQD